MFRLTYLFQSSKFPLILRYKTRPAGYEVWLAVHVSDILLGSIGLLKGTNKHACVLLKFLQQLEIEPEVAWGLRDRLPSNGRDVI